MARERCETSVKGIFTVEKGACVGWGTLSPLYGRIVLAGLSPAPRHLTPLPFLPLPWFVPSPPLHSSPEMKRRPDGSTPLPTVSRWRIIASLWNMQWIRYWIPEELKISINRIIAVRSNLSNRRRREKLFDKVSIKFQTSSPSFAPWSSRSFSRIGGCGCTGLEGCTTPKQGAKISPVDGWRVRGRGGVESRGAAAREKGGRRVDWYEVSWLTRRNNGSKLAREVGVSSHHRAVNPPLSLSPICRGGGF